MADSKHILEGFLQQQKEQPNFVQAVMQALHLPKRGVDIAANYYSGLPGALDPSQEPIPLEDLAAEAVAPDVNASSSLPAQMGKEGVRQMAGGLADPLSYAAGLGSGPGSSVYKPTTSEAQLFSPSKGGRLYRGTEAGDPLKTMREFKGGELGDGVYVTPHERLAASYGGGPEASVKRGTRSVHTYELARSLPPEEVGYLRGGAITGQPSQLVNGNGDVLWSGLWSAKKSEAVTALPGINNAANNAGLRMIIGETDSVAINQVVIRDKSLLNLPGQP